MKACLCSTKVLFGELFYCIMPYQQNEKSTQKWHQLICSKLDSTEWVWTFWVWQVLQQKTKALHVDLTNLIDSLQLHDCLHYVHCIFGFFSSYYIMTTSLTMAVDDCCSSSFFSFLHDWFLWFFIFSSLCLTSYGIFYFIHNTIIHDWLVISKLHPLGVLDTWPWIGIS